MRLFFIGLLLSFNASAGMNKCIIDGSTHYQSSPCPSGTGERISSKNFSGLSTSGVRKDIVDSRVRGKSASSVRKVLNKENLENVKKSYIKRNTTN